MGCGFGWFYDTDSIQNLVRGSLGGLILRWKNNIKNQIRHATEEETSNVEDPALSGQSAHRWR
jgi:hypothetical protein